jgi:hypothetical protein
MSTANLFKTISQIGARYQGNQNRAELDLLKAQNLALKNQNEALKNGQEHNKVVKGDLEIELLNLKIAEKKAELEARGIVGNELPVTNYDDAN